MFKGKKVTEKSEWHTLTIQPDTQKDLLQCIANYTYVGWRLYEMHEDISNYSVTFKKLVKVGTLPCGI